MHSVSATLRQKYPALAVCFGILLLITFIATENILNENNWWNNLMIMVSANMTVPLKKIQYTQILDIKPRASCFCLNYYQ